MSKFSLAAGSKNKGAHGHMYGLDVLRFSAAVLVLLNHFATYSYIKPIITPDISDRSFNFLRVFEGTGAVGVQIFFVISGFVISMTAMSLSGGPGAVRFVAARALRILPALWISAAISLVALWSAGESLVPLLDRFIRSAVLSPVGPYIDGVVWSLVVEMVFYIAIAVAIYFSLNNSFIITALAVGSASAVYILAYVAVILSGNEVVSDIMARFPFKVFLLRHDVFFAVGILIWDIRRNGPNRTTIIAVVFFTAMCLVEIAIDNRAEISRQICAIIIWSAAVFAIIYASEISIPLVLQSKIKFLGDFSYPVYLYHYTTGMVVVWYMHSIDFVGVTGFFISLTIVFSISYFVLLLEGMVRRHFQPLVSRLPKKPFAVAVKGG